MDHKLPVLIGSRAAGILAKLPYDIVVNQFCDYDFIVEENHPLTNIKQHPMYVLDTTVATTRFHKRILELSTLPECQFHIFYTPLGPAKIPPVLLLMAIYKSHLHRVQPYHQKQTLDVEKWFRSCIIYNTLRNKVVLDGIVKSFEELDRLLYDKPTELIRVEHTNFAEIQRTDQLSPIESAVSELYRLGFADVHARLGDQ